MFAAEFEPAESASRRRSARMAVSIDALVAPGGLGRAVCKVTDLSIHGARIQTYSLVRRGTAIWLTLPGIGPVEAEVMWADDFLAGCQFRRPLDSAAFEALAAL